MPQPLEGDIIVADVLGFMRLTCSGLGLYHNLIAARIDQKIDFVSGGVAPEIDLRPFGTMRSTKSSLPIAMLSVQRSSRYPLRFEFLGDYENSCGNIAIRWLA
jgi:hypothetical protein